MIGVLSDEQIRSVLQRQVVGRIGCSDDGKMYIIPITYAWHDGYLYGHSKDGLKIRIMRNNPSVCFQVDEMENMANWRSVLVWGTYEEFSDPEEQEGAMQILMDRVMPMVTSETAKSSSTQPLPHPIEKHTKAIPFRIKIEEQTGRFEKSM